MKFFRWCKHAIQRIKKGYSYRDTWDIEYWFCSIIPKMLEDFAEESIGIPTFLVNRADLEHPEMTNDEKDDWAMNEWRNICREIAHHLREGYETKEQVNEYEDKYFKNKFEILEYEDEVLEEKDKELEEKYLKREMEIEKYQEDELKKGMEMFTKYLGNLWW